MSAIAPALWPRVLMGLVALAALGAGLAWVFRSPAAEPASQIAVAAVEKPVEPVARPQPVVEPPAPPQRVSLQVDSQPSGAEVTRADSHEVLGTTPFVVSLPPQAKVGLDAALAGYQPSHIDVPLEKDAVVKLDLQPVLKVVTPAKPVQTRPSPEKKPKQVSSDKNRTSNPFDE